MKDRLINAEAFKEYCRKGMKRAKPLFRSGTLRQFAEQLTDDICKDIDEIASGDRGENGFGSTGK